MQILNKSIIYENPLPQLRSCHSLFPYSCECADGSILASFTLGQAFESVDHTTYLARSTDGGLSFSKPFRMFEASHYKPDFTESCKVTRLPDGRLAALGYAFDRSDSEKPVGNPETGGLLDDVVFISYSSDNGQSWTPWDLINTRWGPHVEASAWLTVLQSGSWVSPVTGFKSWDGTSTGRNCGRLIRSDDSGKTWSDEAVCMQFEDEEISCYEQRLCQLDSGRIVCIGWNEHLKNGTLFHNHFTISDDDGRTFSDPMSTGILGQASSVCSAGGETLLALHAIRRDSERPGVYAYHVDLSNGRWDILDEKVIWEPEQPIIANKRMAQTFAFLKFGQPGALRLSDGRFLITYWQEKDGQFVTVAMRLSLD